jgi:hypothetical protein
MKINKSQIQLASCEKKKREADEQKLKLENNAAASNSL